MIRRTLLAAAIVLSSVIPACADGLVLKLTRDTVTTLHGNYVEVPGKDQKPVTAKDGPRQEKSDIVVTLYPKSISIQDGKLLQVYDFAQKRIFTANTETKMVSSRSLYATPFFIDAERRNRQLMSQMFQKVFSDPKNKAKLAPGFKAETALDIDLILGSEAKTTTSAEVQKTENDGRVSFASGTRALADYTLSETKVEAPLKRSYAQFIVYNSTTHPVIKKTLYNTGTIFKKLHYLVSDGGKERDITYTLNSVETVPGDATPKTEGFKEVFSQDIRIDQAIRKTRSEKPPAQEAFDKKIQGYVDGKDYTRAVLATMELIIIKGPEAPKASPVVRAALRAGSSDPQAGKIMAAIMKPPASDAEYAETVRTLDSINAVAPEYAHIGDIFKANHAAMWMGSGRKVPAGEITSARAIADKLTSAVSINPWLAGAYLDLAGIRFMGYDMSGATELWEQAERLEPSLPALKKVAEMRAKVEKDFPEYF
jgi:hypothetical protein